MSPEGQIRGKKLAAVPDNVYTVILLVAFCIVFATAVLVAYNCYFQYGTIFEIP